MIPPGKPAAGGPVGTRFIELDGCFNFRDLGGYRTEQGYAVGWGRLYRSDALHRLSPAGLAAFDRLAVATVLDLRTPDEVAERAWVPPDRWPGRWRHVPLLARTPRWSAADRAEPAHPDFAARHYRHIATVGAVGLRSALTTLADPGALPAVFHCAAGKDRTGVLAALVLRLVGVPAETVADDYALSAEATTRWAASVADGQPDDTVSTWTYVPPALLACERATMLTFLDRIDTEYGSVSAFAGRLGIDASTIDRLRAAVLV